jgi:predicted nuclease of predicted toxin-antitoxin system
MAPARGHDAAHARDLGLARTPNEDIFRWAVGQGRIVLTFDLDFGEIAALYPGPRTGVVVFRLHNTRTHHVIDRLAAALARFSPDLQDGAVVLIEESRLRVRRFP